MKQTTVALTLGFAITLLACGPKTEPQVSAPTETAPQVQTPQKEIDPPAGVDKKDVAAEQKQPANAEAEAAVEKQIPVAETAKSPSPNEVEQYLKPTIDEARAKTQTEHSKVRSRSQEAEAEMDALTRNK